MGDRTMSGAVVDTESVARPRWLCDLSVGLALEAAAVAICCAFFFSHRNFVSAYDLLYSGGVIALRSHSRIMIFSAFAASFMVNSLKWVLLLRLYRRGRRRIAIAVAVVLGVTLFIVDPLVI